MSDRLFDTYRNTRYLVEPLGRGGGVRFELRVGERNPDFELLLADEKSAPATWAMLTAYNPGSRRLPSRENQSAHRSLKRLLGQCSTRVWVGRSASEDGEWSEPMWFAAGIPLATALELGRQFGQNAILFGEIGGNARLLASEDGRDESQPSRAPEAAGQGEFEVIVKVGSEGGDVTLLGTRASGAWRFKLESHDWSPVFFDEDPVHTESKLTSEWREALDLLGRYPWQRLHPVEVHPEFRSDIWNEVLRSAEREDGARVDSARWRALCPAH